MHGRSETSSAASSHCHGMLDRELRQCASEPHAAALAPVADMQGLAATVLVCSFMAGLNHGLARRDSSATSAALGVEKQPLQSVTDVSIRPHKGMHRSGSTCPLLASRCFSSTKALM